MPNPLPLHLLLRRLLTMLERAEAALVLPCGTDQLRLFDDRRTNSEMKETV